MLVSCTGIFYVYAGWRCWCNPSPHSNKNLLHLRVGTRVFSMVLYAVPLVKDWQNMTIVLCQVMSGFSALFYGRVCTMFPILSILDLEKVHMFAQSHPEYAPVVIAYDDASRNFYSWNEDDERAWARLMKDMLADGLSVSAASTSVQATPSSSSASKADDTLSQQSRQIAPIFAFAARKALPHTSLQRAMKSQKPQRQERHISKGSTPHGHSKKNCNQRLRMPQQLRDSDCKQRTLDQFFGQK